MPVKEEKKEEEEESAPGSTLFIKNLNFDTTEEKLQEVGHFINTTLTHVLILYVLKHNVVFFICCRHSPNVGRSSHAPSPRREIK